MSRPPLAPSARAALAMMICLAGGCAGVDDARPVDAALDPDRGPADARPAVDAAAPDAASPDMVLLDMALFDGALPDMASPDMAPPDVAPPDMAPLDMASPDMAPPDMGPVVDLYPTPGWRFPLRGVCPGGYGPPTPTGALDDPALAEISGLVPSPSREGLLWAHVDSGGEAILYALSTEGESLGRHQLRVDADDWEDLAAASCPDRSGPCLWVADTGDNALERPLVAIYATPEPAVLDGVARRVWRFPAGFPDGPVDVEAMVVAPDGSTFWLFEKAAAERVRVFAPVAPLDEGRVARLEVVATLAAPGIPIENGRLITAADLHPEGQRVALRVYTGSYEYRLPAPLGLASLGDLDPFDIALGPLSEPQGEAIAYDADGTGIWTVSERGDREAQPLNHYPCRE